MYAKFVKFKISKEKSCSYFNSVLIGLIERLSGATVTVQTNLWTEHLPFDFPPSLPSNIFTPPTTMAPKHLDSDISDIKQSLDHLCKTFDDMKATTTKNEQQLAELMKLLKQKYDKIIQLTTRIDNPESTVSSLEQNSKRKNIIATGLNIHSFAHCAQTQPTSSSDSPADQTIDESATMKINFIAFAHDKLHVDIPEIEITAIHNLPKRKDGTTPISIQFLSSDKRTEIMRKRKTLKGTNIFLNDHLSRLNNALFHRARTLRK